MFKLTPASLHCVVGILCGEWPLIHDDGTLVTLVILTVIPRRAAALTDAALIKLKKKVSAYYSSESQFIIHPPAVEGFR